MINVLLTQNDGAILGPIAKLLGYIMDAIFNGLLAIGVPSIGLSIILFTLVIYLFMMPLTIKQQKFSKLSAKMNPELQAIQAKYKNKKDNDSMTRMNEETKAVYEKYGTSPTGSCLQLIIQMPILFALYRVIYNIPAYVDTVKQAFIPFVSKFIEQPGSLDFIQNKENFANASQFSKQFSNELFTGGNKEYITNTVIDILNKASTSEWHNIYANGNFESLKDLVTNVSKTGSLDLIERYNSFLGLNISNSPSYIMKEAFSTGSYLLVVGAVLIPVLAALTQWLNTKLMPQPQTTDQQSTVASSMKSMNVMMPIMSAVFCFTLPAGMGLYWIAGAVIRSIQQIAINKYIDKEDLDEVIRKNVEKAKKKRDKLGVPSQTVTNSAKISTKTIIDENKIEKTQANKDEAVKKATEYYNKGVKPGSIASKANMVKQFNEKNNK